ncbi:hypothetical protein BLD44_019750 [Mastigocladus laminosus UU774]|nr:hypothetical protein BLD44_019750 [Mastigocladus laminosus UU774]
MGIKKKNPPAKSERALVEGLNNLPPGLARSKKGRFFAESATQFKPGSPNVIQHPVYTVSLQELAESGLANAKQTSWRYVYPKRNKNDDEFAVEVAIDEAGQNHAFLNTEEGDFVPGTMSAIKKAERLERSQKNDYELRVLKIPAIYLFALWLKDEQGDDDIFVPLVEASPQLEAKEEYSKEEFERILRQDAQQQLQAQQQLEFPEPTDDDTPPLGGSVSL